MCLPSAPCASGASSVERAGLAHPAPHSDPVVKLDHAGNGLFMTAPLFPPTQSHSLSLAFTHPSSPSVPPLFSSIFSFPPFLPLSLPLFLFVLLMVSLALQNFYFCSYFPILWSQLYKAPRPKAKVYNFSSYVFFLPSYCFRAYIQVCSPF